MCKLAMLVHACESSTWESREAGCHLVGAVIVDTCILSSGKGRRQENQQFQASLMRLGFK